MKQSVGSLLSLALLLGAACGGAPGDVALADLRSVNAADLGAGADLFGTAPPDLHRALGPYPTGPYGGAVGDVVPDVVLPGYWSPSKTTGLATSEPYGTVTFDGIRTSGARYALVHMVGYA